MVFSYLVQHTSRSVSNCGVSQFCTTYILICLTLWCFFIWYNTHLALVHTVVFSYLVQHTSCSASTCGVSQFDTTHILSLFNTAGFLLFCFLHFVCFCFVLHFFNSYNTYPASFYAMVFLSLTLHISCSSWHCDLSQTGALIHTEYVCLSCHL